MNAIPFPTTLKYYILLRLDKTTGSHFCEYGPNGSLTWVSLEEAQHKQVLLTLQNPNNQYEIFPIEWPLSR